MNEKMVLALIIGVAVVIVVLILRRSLSGGKLRIGPKGIDASLKANQPAATTRVDTEKAAFGSENEVTVQGDTEANMREMKAGKKNKFNFGDVSQK
ncbi:MAG TPA: hypothetical protein VGW57_11010 [Chthoniobacterales bacterium]|nr:hypothetical protein [Chthoniobacterales bacterium]